MQYRINRKIAPIHLFSCPLEMVLTIIFEFWFQSFGPPQFQTQEADPKKVASIILGGGAGTRLFPLTGKRAKPAVKLY